MVPLYATVTDASKRLVPDLEQADFQVFDNDKPQEIQLFANEVQPITVAVMLDTSASMTGSFRLLQNAAEQFVLRLLPNDRARVGAFNDKVEFVSPMTGNRDRLVASLKEVDFGNPTRLYDGIEAGLKEMEEVKGRRVVLVFTDGDDTSSSIGAGEVLERARNSEVIIYAIGLTCY